LAATHSPRALLGLELIDRVEGDPAVAPGVADDAVQGCQAPAEVLGEQPLRRSSSSSSAIVSTVIDAMRREASAGSR
jgi:hypothetical protein